MSEQQSCDILGYLRQARAMALEMQRLNPDEKSRELSICLTHIDTALLWRLEDMRLKTPTINMKNTDN